MFIKPDPIIIKRGAIVLGGAVALWALLIVRLFWLQIVSYDEYDIAPLLSKGKNAIGIILGNGFANQTCGRWFFSESSFRAPLSVGINLSASGEGKEFKLEQMQDMFLRQ